MPGPPPLKGTVVRPAPVSELISSMEKCPSVPAPAVPTRTFPGFFFENSSISRKPLKGASCRTTTTSGLRAAMPSDVKSFSGSYVTVSGLRIRPAVMLELGASRIV